MEKCSVRDAALKLAKWFEVGESQTATEEQESVGTCSEGAHDSLIQKLEGEISELERRAQEIESAVTFRKQLIAALQGE